ncbi:MAG TPA: hypothetical protein VHC22_30200 [Pirellulales bacterium]|nr:hypothetical protein [Pirellulales bacterium]
MRQHDAFSLFGVVNSRHVRATRKCLTVGGNSRGDAGTGVLLAESLSAFRADYVFAGHGARQPGTAFIEENVGAHRGGPVGDGEWYVVMAVRAAR